MPEVRPIDANALKSKLKIDTNTATYSDYCNGYCDARQVDLDAIDAAPTIEPEVRIIPKEVSATDIDKLTEMIKGSLLQAYPNDVMFTAVRHGQWTKIEPTIGLQPRWKCSRSECGGIVHAITDYCPYCGARMDGGAEQ